MPRREILSFFFQQTHRVAGHALALTGEAQVLLRGSLYVDPGGVNAQMYGDVFPHPVDIGPQLGSLGDHGHIDVADFIARGIDFFNSSFPDSA